MTVDTSASSLSRRSFLLASSMFLGASAFGQLDVRTLKVADTAAPRGRRRRLLQKQCPPDALRQSLLPLNQYKPYPQLGDPAWAALRPETRAALLKAGEAKLNFDFKPFPATLFLAYARNGNRSVYEAQRNANLYALRALTMAECVENKGRFLDDIANGLWQICEESFWGVPAHLYIQHADLGLPDPREPIVDLFVGDTSAEVVRTVYLLGPKLDTVSPILRERVYAECERRVLNPLIEHNFAWMGLPGGKRRDDLPWDATPADQVQPVNNWDAWICWNWLTTALLIDRDPKRRTAGIQKAMVCLDNFIDTYPDDGGCEEGCSYWNRAAGSMADALELLHSGTAGRVNIWSNPLLRNMGEYFVKANIAGPLYLNTGDAHTHVAMNVATVFQFGQRVHSPDMMALAKSSMRSPYVPDTLPAIFEEKTLLSANPGPAPLLKSVWLPDTGLMVERQTGGTVKGLYTACIAADNGKSHSHNDTGSFWVYLDGEPVIIDLGAESYRKQSFDVHRYESESMQSAYHNLPTVNNIQQGIGSAFRAQNLVYKPTGSLQFELTAAYPETAAINTWKRTIALDRPTTTVTVEDRFDLKSPAPIAWSLITCRKVTVTPGVLHFAPRTQDKSAELQMTFDAAALQATVEDLPLTSEGLTESWGPLVYRVLLKTKAESAKGRIAMNFKAT